MEVARERTKFGKVPVVAQLMRRMVGDALAAQAEGAQHRWQGAASPQGGARKGAGHRSAQPHYYSEVNFTFSLSYYGMAMQSEEKT